MSNWYLGKGTVGDVNHRRRALRRHHHDADARAHPARGRESWYVPELALPERPAVSSVRVHRRLELRASSESCRGCREREFAFRLLRPSPGISGAAGPRLQKPAGPLRSSIHTRHPNDILHTFLDLQVVDVLIVGPHVQRVGESTGLRNGWFVVVRIILDIVCAFGGHPHRSPGAHPTTSADRRPQQHSAGKSYVMVRGTESPITTATIEFTFHPRSFATRNPRTTGAAADSILR